MPNESTATDSAAEAVAATPGATPAPATPKASFLASLASELSEAHSKENEQALPDQDTQSDEPEPAEATREQPDGDKPAPPKEGGKTKQAPTIEGLQALAKEGDVSGILKALGLDPKGARGIPEARFAELRKHAATVKQREKAAEDQEKEREAAWSAREAEFQGIAKTLHDEVSAIRAAREARKAGRVQEALRLAFGDEDIDELLTESVKEKTGKDPEAYRLIKQMQQELRAEREEKARARQEAEQRAQHAAEQEAQRKEAEAQTQRQAAYREQLLKNVKADEGPVFERATKAEQAATLAHVLMQIQLREYNESGIEISHSEALERFRAENKLWSDILGTSGPTGEDTDQAGSQPENTDRAGSSPARRNGAAQRHTRAAQAKPAVPETQEQFLARLAAEMRRAHDEQPQ